MKTYKKIVIKELGMKRCAYCFSTEDLTIDHKHPKILGGTNNVRNLQCLCGRCNKMKSGIPHGQLIRIFQWHKIIEEEKAFRRNAGREILSKEKMDKGISEVAEINRNRKFTIVQRIKRLFVK